MSGDVFARFGDYQAWLPAAMLAGTVRTLIAGAGDTPVGFALVALSAEEPDEVELLAIAVLPDRQGQGVGRRLLAAAEDEARRLVPDGRAALRLTVAEDNLPALKLFRESGYTRAARPAGRYPGGQRSFDFRREL